MPTKIEWHTETWKIPTEGKWRGSKGGLIWPGDIAVETIGDINYGTLFTYMFRRFGPAEHGSDDYKDIANWFLTTPDKNIVLIVSPNPSGCRYSFGYMVNQDVFSGRLNEDQNSIMTEALKTTMCDLLFPTYVRDVFINAGGRMKDEDVIEGSCSYFKWAGYGVDHKYFDEQFGDIPKSDGER